MQALFYAVPVIYPVSMIATTSGAAAKLLLLDPIAQVIQDVRYCLITTETVTTTGFVGGWGEVLAIALVIIVFAIGAVIFRRKSRFFAEEV